jgi:transposase
MTDQARREWDPEEFVRLWCTDATPEEIAATLGRKVTQVANYAAVLRKRGVKLPMKHRGRGAPINAAQLNRIVDEIASATPEQPKESSR